MPTLPRWWILTDISEILQMGEQHRPSLGGQVRKSIASQRERGAWVGRQRLQAWREET